MPYKHFTSEKRNELAALLRAKVKKKDIAKQLRRDRTTIWRVNINHLYLARHAFFVK